MEDQSRFASLNRREKECLRLVYDRRTTKEIAAELKLSPGTVYRYISDAQAKLGARNRRVAAEMLRAAEATDTIKPYPNSNWLAPAPGNTASISPDATFDWTRVLPIRARGAMHNDLSRTARLAWIFILAAALAIGFGMLAIVAEVFSNILARLG